MKSRPWWGERRPVGAVRATPRAESVSDEDLMSQLAAGRQEALGPLYTRYAQRIFNLAVQSLDRAGAEEIVQDVFLAVWRKADTFSPERGAFRPWIFQIAHYRILNELRLRSRRPQAEPDPEGAHLAALSDPDAEPGEVMGREEDRALVRSALEALPPDQRKALSLAFLQDLTHEQVAAELNLPLGTAKTRIRAGLQKMRAQLSPLVAAVVLGVMGLAALGIGFHADYTARQRDERALTLVTSSTTVAIRLTAAPGTPDATHATYRGHSGATIAVLTFSYFPPAPTGQTYQAWVLHAGTWTSLGTARPDANGSARLIAEGPELAELPEAIEVTQEPLKGSASPTGRVVVIAHLAQ